MPFRHRYSKFLTSLVMIVAIMGSALQAPVAAESTDPYSYFTWRDYRIAYRIEGSGPALLLVHSVDLGGSSAEWDKVIPLFAQHFTVYSFDFPGFGKSERSEMVYTSDLLRDLLRDFVVGVVRQKAILMANGLGCAYAARIAADVPDAVSHLILISPQGLVRMGHPPGPVGHIFYQLFRLPGLSRMIQKLAVSRDALRMRYRDQFANDLDLEAYLDLSRLWLKQRESKAAVVAILSGQLNENLKRPLKRMKVPILLMIGDAGPGEHRLIRRIKKVNPATRARVIHHSRRWPQFTQPEAFYDEVTQFLGIYGTEEDKEVLSEISSPL